MNASEFLDASDAAQSGARLSAGAFLDAQGTPARESAPANGGMRGPFDSLNKQSDAIKNGERREAKSAGAFLDGPEAAAASSDDGLMATVRGMFRHFWDDVRGPGSVMEGYDPAQGVRAENRPSPVAPLNNGYYRALQSVLNTAAPGQRDALARRDDVTGTAAREIQRRQAERTTRPVTALEQLDQPLPSGSIKSSDYQGFGKEGVNRYWSDFSSGVVGSTGATLSFTGRRLGVQSLRELGEAMTNYAERSTPSRQTFADELVGAVGSMASYYAPGLGVVKGSTALATLSPVLAKWAGAGTMAGLEASAEADQVYKDNVRAGHTDQEASSRADKAFAANLVLLGVTNKAGFFNDVRGLGRRVATAAAVEGPGQEAPQQLIQNYLTDRPLGEGVGKAAAIGSIVGGGARGVSSLAEPARPVSLDEGFATTADRVLSAPTVDHAIAAALEAMHVTSSLRAPAKRAGASAVAFLDGADAGSAIQGPTAQNALPASDINPLASAEAAPGLLRETNLFSAEPTASTATTGAPEMLKHVEGLGPETHPKVTGQSASVFLGEHGAIGPATDPFNPSEPAADAARRAFEAAGVPQAATPPHFSDAAGQVEPSATSMAERMRTSELDELAHEAATSPLNSLQQPTEAQKRVGNYKKAAVRIGGLDVSVENPAGSERSGVDETGKPWSSTLEAHYGYVKGVPARAPDKEHIDVFIKPGTPLDFDGDVFVVDQNRKSGHFDEPKAILGASSVREARDIYLANYSADQVNRIRAITRLPINEFRARLQDTRGFAQPQPESAIAGRPVAKLSERELEHAVEAGRGGVRQIAADELERRTGASGGDETDNGESRAATGVMMSPAYTAAGGAVTDVGRARPDAIRQSIRELLNVPINEGHFKHSRDALGIYKIKPQTIRVKNQNDIGVISHETGHHFSETSRPVRQLMTAHEGELRSITPYAAQQKSAALQREEGFAEYLRLLWTQPQAAQTRAPGFHAAFAQYVDDNGYRPAFNQIEGAIGDWHNLPPTDRILAKVGRSADRPKASELLDRFIFETLDRYHPLKRMVADLKSDVAPSKDPFKAAQLLAGDGAVIEDWVTTQTVPFDPTKRADPNTYGKPLREILQPVAGSEEQLRGFKAYIIAVRAQELMKHGKEHLFTREEIAAGLKLETPAYKRAADELVAYNDRLIDYAVEGGLLSPAIADRLSQYGAYTVPFFRESENGPQAGGGKNPIKRIFGGTENLRDPIANLIQNTANIIHATNRNAVLVKASELAKSIRGGGRWIEQIPIPDSVLNVPKRAILDAFEKQGLTLDPKDAAVLAQIQKLIVPQPNDVASERIVIVRVNGEPKALQVNDTLLFRALGSFEPVDLGLIESMLSVPADLLRSGVTLSPEFMARNFMRDTLSGFIQSKAGILPITSTIGGFKEIVTRSDTARLYRAFGSAYADMWHGESEKSRKILERMARRGKFDPRTILTPRGVIEVLKHFGSISEAGTRIAEFKKTARPSDIDSLFEAAYRAREVSVDFGMHGANRAVRMLTRITPFLNPAMQGLYKAARSGREQFGLTLLRGSVLTAFSIALYMLNRDEEWYDELEKWERNVYWHFDVGLRDNKDQVIPLRVPKPFEWGAIFGSVPEALAQVAIDQQPKRFAKRLASIWSDVFALRAIPTALLVPTELWANKNNFTDRRIVPEYKERLDPELQYGPQTSLTAREIGSTADVSPAKVDHLIRGFFGTMGMYSVMLSDQVVRKLGNYPDLPASTWRQMPVVRAFVHDPASPNSRSINEFYELLEKARRSEATYKRLPADRSEAYLERRRDDIEGAQGANAAAREMAALRKENEEIRESRDYTGREKLQLMYDNNLQIRMLAREFMRQQAAEKGASR
jgi:hypothetical protein